MAHRTSNSLWDGNVGDSPEPEVSLGPLFAGPGLPGKPTAPGIGEAEPRNSVERWGAWSRCLPLVETTLSGLETPSRLAVVNLPSWLVSVWTHRATPGSSGCGKLATSLIGSHLKLYHCMSFPSPPLTPCPYSGKSEWFFECCFPGQRTPSDLLIQLTCRTAKLSPGKVGKGLSSQYSRKDRVRLGL